MNFKRFIATWLLAGASVVMIAPAGVQAQMAADIEWLWCNRMRESLVRNYQTVERMRAGHQAGINTLRAEHQLPATRNLEQLYWKKAVALFKQKRALDADYNGLYIRPDAPSPGQKAPLPQRPQPRPNETWRYPPY